MTRHLILLRHAQAMPALSGQIDAQRALTPAGIAQCAAMARRLASVKLETVLVSPALRTRETARLVLEDRAIPEIADELYDATTDKLAGIVQSLSVDCHHAMIVAHNPGLSLFANRLDGSAMDEMATACGISFLVDGDWSDVLDGACLMDWRVSP